MLLLNLKIITMLVPNTLVVNMFTTKKLKKVSLCNLQFQSRIYIDSVPPHMAPLRIYEVHPNYDTLRVSRLEIVPTKY